MSYEAHRPTVDGPAQFVPVTEIRLWGLWRLTWSIWWRLALISVGASWGIGALLSLLAPIAGIGA